MTTQPVEITPRPEAGQLVFKPARRGKPPLHIADFDMAGRKAFLKDAGYPAFRASQLSKHYFERFEADPEADLARVPPPSAGPWTVCRGA